jgi:hypothetical protein
VHCRKILLPLNSVLPTFFSTPMQILIAIENCYKWLGNAVQNGVESVKYKISGILLFKTFMLMTK